VWGQRGRKSTSIDPTLNLFSIYQLLVESPDSSSELSSADENPSEEDSSCSVKDTSSGFLAINPFIFWSNPIISLLFPVLNTLALSQSGFGY